MSRRERGQSKENSNGREQGQVILLAGARIELWQANALGRYDHPSDPNPAFQQIPRNREGLIAELRSAPVGEDRAIRLVDWTVVLPKG